MRLLSKAYQHIPVQLLFSVYGLANALRNVVSCRHHDNDDTHLRRLSASISSCVPHSGNDCELYKR
eukprot:365856-Chlamydomonas_euryale.AAC.14